MGKFDIEVHTDGSWRKGINAVNGSAIILIGGKPISAMRFVSNDLSLIKHQQIAGEVFSALYVLEFIRDNLTDGNVKPTVTMCYDYEGVKEWVPGFKWKNANNDMSKCYKRRVGAVCRGLNEAGINVVWKHEYGHSGNYYNELADRIAKTGDFGELAELSDGAVEYHMESGNVVFGKVVE